MENEYGSHYDAELVEKIQFFRIHPSYLPFIGKNYDDYKILQVGESHYINQTKENIKYDVKYFYEHWWNSSFAKELKSLDGNGYEGGCERWVNTRLTVGRNFCDKFERSRAYSTFRNPLKEFEKLTGLSRDDNNYNYFAFMNFFQMPALISGMKFWESLKKSKNGWKDGDIELWNKTCDESIKIFDAVVDIIKPNIVIITSISAYNAYVNVESTGKYKNDERLHVVCHPGCSWWYKKNKSGISGKNKLNEILKDYILR